MIITQYDVKESKSNDNMAYLSFSMDKDFALRTGNEHFYRFIGENSCYPLPNMIHPMDVKEFLEAAMNLDEGPQKIIIRLKDIDGNYRTMVLIMELSDKIIKDENAIDVQMYDILRLASRYQKNLDVNNKYRIVMGLTDCRYFEYDKATDMFKIYMYLNGKSVMLDMMPLDDWYEQCIKRGYVDEYNKMYLEAFCDNLRRANGTFTIRMETKFISKGERTDKITISGEITTYFDGSMYVVGVIKTTGNIGRSTVTDYYAEANRDGATGLLNKKAIIQYAMNKIEDPLVNNLYMVVVDIDDFKQINDTYGHLFGDEVIAKVANTVRNVVGTKGMVGRFGGDEFLLVLENLEGESELRTILKSFAKQVAWLYTGTNQNLTVTLSMGVSQYPDNATEYDKMFKIADRALYIAKQKGKNRYIIYREHMHGTIEDNEVSENAIGFRFLLEANKLNAVVSDMILALHKNGKDAINATLEKILACFDVDGIAVYSGDELNRTYSIGKYIDPISSMAGLTDEGYIKKCGDTDVIVENNAKAISNYCKPLAEAMHKQEVTATIQCVARDGEDVKAVVSFDVFNRSRKWGGVDLEYLPLVGKFIAQIIIG